MGVRSQMSRINFFSFNESNERLVFVVTGFSFADFLH